MPQDVQAPATTDDPAAPAPGADASSQPAGPDARAPVLPPPYRARKVAADPFAAAVAAAAAGTAGAGDLLWSLSRGGDGPGILAFALVLEPEDDRPLAQARLAHWAAMAALADAVARHGPAERRVTVDPPGLLRFDGLPLGQGRLAAPRGAAEDAVPAWLVFGAALTADRAHLAEPGLVPDATSLAEEEIADPLAVLESFAAWFMRHLDRWRHQGPQALGAALAPRLPQGQRIEADGTWRRGPAGLTLAALLAEPGAGRRG